MSRSTASEPSPTRTICSRERWAIQRSPATSEPSTRRPNSSTRSTPSRCAVRRLAVGAQHGDALHGEAQQERSQHDQVGAAASAHGHHDGPRQQHHLGRGRQRAQQHGRGPHRRVDATLLQRRDGPEPGDEEGPAEVGDRRVHLGEHDRRGDDHQAERPPQVGRAHDRPGRAHHDQAEDGADQGGADREVGRERLDRDEPGAQGDDAAGELGVVGVAPEQRLGRGQAEGVTGEVPAVLRPDRVPGRLARLAQQLDGDGRDEEGDAGAHRPQRMGPAARRGIGRWPDRPRDRSRLRRSSPAWWLMAGPPVIMPRPARPVARGRGLPAAWPRSG